MRQECINDLFYINIHILLTHFEPVSVMKEFYNLFLNFVWKTIKNHCFDTENRKIHQMYKLKYVIK